MQDEEFQQINLKVEGDAPGGLPEVAVKCRECLIEYQSGKIDWPEVERRLAIITVKYCLPDMREKPIPTPPQDVADFLSKGKLDRQTFLIKYPEFHRIKEVSDYFENYSKVLNLNERNYNELKNLKQHVKKPENIAAINRALDTFQATEERLQVVAGNIENEPEINNVVKTFGGSVRVAVPRYAKKGWED